MRSTTKRRHTVTFILMLVMAVFLLSSGSVYAAKKSVTVKPSGKNNSTDLGRINKALKKYKVVKLKKGKKYYLSNPIHIRSNRTIIANGATIIAKGNILITDAKKTGYANVKNVTISGGKWKSTKKAGYKGSSFCFIHSSGIRLENMTIDHTGYNGHAIELVACQNVQINGVKINPQGTPGQSLESMVQIDIATDSTYPRLKGTKFSNGAVCQNVVISNCTITGNRGIASGYDYSGQGYANNAHANIQLLNNTIVGKNAEGVFLANTKNAVVKGNTIESYCSALGSVKSIGLHYLITGNVAGCSFICEKNTIRGGLHSVRAYSQSGVRISSAVIKNNRCYCKNGTYSAIMASSHGVANAVTEGNQVYAW